MKLFEVFSDAEEDQTEWQSQSYADFADAYFTDIEDRMLHVEFVTVPSLERYLEMMNQSPLLEPDVEDIQRAAESIFERVPEIRDQSLINVGIGIDMSPRTVNWGDMKKSLQVLRAVAKKVLTHSESNRGKYYIFGTEEHKKAKLFFKLIKRFASDAHFVEKPEGASEFCFVIAKR